MSLDVAKIVRNEFQLLARCVKTQASMLRPTVVNNLALAAAAMSALLNVSMILLPFIRRNQLTPSISLLDTFPQSTPSG